MDQNIGDVENKNSGELIHQYNVEDNHEALEKIGDCDSSLSENIKNVESREDRLKRLKEKSEEERQKKLTEIMESQKRAHELRLKEQEERRKKIEEISKREEDRRKRVEQRKKELATLEKEKNEKLMRRTKEREERAAIQKQQHRNSLCPSMTQSLIMVQSATSPRSNTSGSTSSGSGPNTNRMNSSVHAYINHNSLSSINNSHDKTSNMTSSQFSTTRTGNTKPCKDRLSRLNKSLAVPPGFIQLDNGQLLPANTRHIGCFMPHRGPSPNRRVKGVLAWSKQSTKVRSGGAGLAWWQDINSNNNSSSNTNNNNNASPNTTSTNITTSTPAKSSRSKYVPLRTKSAHASLATVKKRQRLMGDDSCSDNCGDNICNFGGDTTNLDGVAVSYSASTHFTNNNNNNKTRSTGNTHKYSVSIPNNLHEAGVKVQLDANYQHHQSTACLTTNNNNKNNNLKNRNKILNNNNNINDNDGDTTCSITTPSNKSTTTVKMLKSLSHQNIPSATNKSPLLRRPLRVPSVKTAPLTPRCAKPIPSSSSSLYDRLSKPKRSDSQPPPPTQPTTLTTSTHKPQIMTRSFMKPTASSTGGITKKPRSNSLSISQNKPKKTSVDVVSSTFATEITTTSVSTPRSRDDENENDVKKSSQPASTIDSGITNTSSPYTSEAEAAGLPEITINPLENKEESDSNNVGDGGDQIVLTNNTKQTESAENTSSTTPVSSYQANDSVVETPNKPTKTTLSEPSESIATAIVSKESVDNVGLSEEELYRKKLAEQKKLARERKEKQLEEQRKVEQEMRQKVADERKRMEEEARKAREEIERQIREDEERQQLELEKLRQLEEEEQRKRDEAIRVEEENRLEKARKEEEQRMERKRRLEKIMSRVKKADDGTLSNSPSANMCESNNSTNDVQPNVDNNLTLTNTNTIVNDAEMDVINVNDSVDNDNVMAGGDNSMILSSSSPPKEAWTVDQMKQSSSQDNSDDDNRNNNNINNNNNNTGDQNSVKFYSPAPISDNILDLTCPSPPNTSYTDLATPVTSINNNNYTSPSTEPQFKSRLLQNMLAKGRLKTGSSPTTSSTNLLSSSQSSLNAVNNNGSSCDTTQISNNQSDLPSKRHSLVLTNWRPEEPNNNENVAVDSSLSDNLMSQSQSFNCELTNIGDKNANFSQSQNGLSQFDNDIDSKLNNSHSHGNGNTNANNGHYNGDSGDNTDSQNNHYNVVTSDNGQEGEEEDESHSNCSASVVLEDKTPCQDAVSVSTTEGCVVGNSDVVSTPTTNSPL